MPTQFFLPNRLMLFLTPMPESACASTVVGSRTRRMPRWAIAAANDDHVEHGAAADDDDERLAVEAGVVDALEQRQRVDDVVLDRLAAGHDHRRRYELQSTRSGQRNSPAPRPAKCRLRAAT